MSILAVFDEDEISRYYSQYHDFSYSFSTGKIGNAAKHPNEQRTIDQYDFVRKIKITYEDMDEDQRADLVEFFVGHFGGGIGFRCYSVHDHKFRNDIIGVGNGVETTFYLQRQYKVRSRSISRRVMKPIYPLATVTVDGEKVMIDDDGTPLEPAGDEDILAGNAVTIDWNSGEVVFDVAPAVGELIRVARGEFHIPVYFLSDTFSGRDYNTYTNSDTIELIEILPSALGAGDDDLPIPTMAFVMPLAGSAVPATFDVSFATENVDTISLFIDGELYAVSTDGPSFLFENVPRPGDEGFHLEAVGTNASGQVVVAGIDLLVDFGETDFIVFTGNIGGTDYVDEPVVFTGNIDGVDYVNEPVIRTTYEGRSG